MENTVEYTRRGYQKLPLIENVPGFIVNIHDGANFDIDVKLTDEQLRYYRSVIKGSYQYVEYNDKLLQSGGEIVLENKRGISYRCHLRGVSMNKTEMKSYTRINKQMVNEIEQLLNYSNWKVLCTISDIDIYSRLLIDIYIPCPFGYVDLRKFLLSKTEAETYKIATAYTPELMNKY